MRFLSHHNDAWWYKCYLRYVEMLYLAWYALQISQIKHHSCLLGHLIQLQTQESSCCCIKNVHYINKINKWMPSFYIIVCFNVINDSYRESDSSLTLSVSGRCSCHKVYYVFNYLSVNADINSWTLRIKNAWA